MERLSTGISGLDEATQGGLAKGSTVLLSGRPGTGKTILGLQFLMEGVENGEKCMYISLEEIEEDLKEQAKQFGWDLEKAEEEGKLEIQSIKPRDFKDRFSRRRFEDKGIERMVVDSITPLTELRIDSKTSSRSFLHKTLSGVKKAGITTIFVSEIGENGGLSRDGVSEYVCDGVIKLDSKSIGSGVERTLAVVKMRSTEIDGGIKSLEFTENGIQVE